MDSAEILRGRYACHGSSFEPDRGMLLINQKVKEMRLLFDAGCGVPSFYFDPATMTYWQYTELEGYRKELKRVDRSLIEAEYPTVDCSRVVDP